MLFWHVGGAVFLFRALFKDPDVDLRFLMAGAVLPDVIDITVGLSDPARRSRLWKTGIITT